MDYALMALSCFFVALQTLKWMFRPVSRVRGRTPDVAGIRQRWLRERLLHLRLLVFRRGSGSRPTTSAPPLHSAAKPMPACFCVATRRAAHSCDSAETGLLVSLQCAQPPTPVGSKAVSSLTWPSAMRICPHLPSAETAPFFSPQPAAALVPSARPGARRAVTRACSASASSPPAAWPLPRRSSGCARANTCCLGAHPLPSSLRAVSAALQMRSCWR